MMGNPIRPYINEIGTLLANLGNELCRQANSTAPLNLHGVVNYSMDHICFNLHNLSADLNKWRKEMLERDGKIQLPNISQGTDGADVESTYSALLHLLHSNYIDVDSGIEHSLTEELQKLEWLMEELQNKPDAIRYSKAKHEDFSFDKITEDR